MNYWEQETAQRQKNFHGSSKSGNHIGLEQALTVLTIKTQRADNIDGYEWSLRLQDAAGARATIPLFAPDLSRLRQEIDRVAKEAGISIY